MIWCDKPSRQLMLRILGLRDFRYKMNRQEINCYWWLWSHCVVCSIKIGLFASQLLTTIEESTWWTRFILCNYFAICCNIKQIERLEVSLGQTDQQITCITCLQDDFVWNLVIHFDRVIIVINRAKSISQNYNYELISPLWNWSQQIMLSVFWREAVSINDINKHSIILQDMQPFVAWSFSYDLILPFINAGRFFQYAFEYLTWRC